MDDIITQVTQYTDTRNHRLEVCYSIQHVLILHGESRVQSWQERVQHFPDALAEKLITENLADLKLDMIMHIEREDWLLVYEVLVAAQTHLLKALFALNRVYPPEFKRLRDLVQEIPLKPDHLADRLDAVLRGDPQQIIPTFDSLAEDVFALVAEHKPHIDLTPIRKHFYTRRQAVIDPPI